MAFLNSLNISGSGLTAQKLRMNVIAQNIANASTTRTENGQPYRRKLVVLQAKDGAQFQNSLNQAIINKNANPGGVEVDAVVESTEDLKPVYDPDNPDANADGYVMMPNVDMTEEMIDMISASRSYEANLTAFNAVKMMASKALEIGR